PQDLANDINLLNDEQAWRRAVSTSGASVQLKDGTIGKVVTPADEPGTASLGRVLVAHELDGQQVERFYPALQLDVPDGVLKQEKRGAIRFGPDRQFTIALLERADPSTFLHESGHFFLEVFGDLADRLGAQDPAGLTDAQRKLLSDYGQLFEHFGIERRDQLGVEQHEQFARTFEAYLMEGKAPDIALQ